MGLPDHNPSLMGISLRKLSLGLLTIQFSTFVLLLHYSRVMPTAVDDVWSGGGGARRYLPSTAVFLVEVMKLAICLTFALYEVSLTLPRTTTTATALLGATGAAVFAGDSWKMALPASLYTLANSLQYVGISNLDAATFHVAYQLKIIFTALFSVTLLRRPLNPRQWIALLLLMVGVATVSLPQGDGGSLASSHHTHIYAPRSVSLVREYFGLSGSAATHLLKRSATYEGIEEDELALDSLVMDTSVGLLSVIGVCICSGLAGVYFEKLLKDSPKGGTSLWIRNVQMSTYSLFPAFFIGVLFMDGETVAKYGFFAGYNWIVVLSIAIQSFGGIVAAFCIFYADNISKNFAISISMVLSSLASFLFFDFEGTTNFVIGTIIVLFATYLYSIQEKQTPNPPKINTNTNEKIRSTQAFAGAQDRSIMLPRTPLTADDGITTSRPGSPNHKKRRSDQVVGYSAKVL